MEKSRHCCFSRLGLDPKRPKSAKKSIWRTCPTGVIFLTTRTCFMTKCFLLLLITSKLVTYRTIYSIKLCCVTMRKDANKNVNPLSHTVLSRFVAHASLSEHMPLLEYRCTEVYRNIHIIGAPAFSINSQKRVFFSYRRMCQKAQ